MGAITCTNTIYELNMVTRGTGLLCRTKIVL